MNKGPEKNEVGWFDEEQNSGLLTARLATDAADVKFVISERISVILQNMTSLLISFIVAFIVEWRLSFLILATFPLMVLANFAQVDWTPELHRMFVQAVEQLGVAKAVPSRILRIMGIDCLTRDNIASHLQGG